MPPMPRHANPTGWPVVPTWPPMDGGPDPTATARTTVPLPVTTPLRCRTGHGPTMRAQLRKAASRKTPAGSAGQRDLLVLLGAPPRAVHHPQKVGLHPTHPGIAEAAAEHPVLDRESADGRTVRLVLDDAVIVELREDVAPLLGPYFYLILIQFRDQRHR